MHVEIIKDINITRFHILKILYQHYAKKQKIKFILCIILFLDQGAKLMNEEQCTKRHCDYDRSRLSLIGKWNFIPL